MNRFVTASGSSTVKVSERGQMSLPAETRRRWGIQSGGTVGAIDLGDVVVLVPGGVVEARRVLLDRLDAIVWSGAARGFGDHELAND